MVRRLPAKQYSVGSIPTSVSDRLAAGLGRADILNIGGFSDAAFHVVASYVTGDTARFVAEIEAIKL